MTTLNISISPQEAQQHALRLLDVGIYTLSCWGGGHYLPGTHFKELADDPPTRDQVAGADYRGGLAAILGTAHSIGGYVLGLDVDAGATAMPRPTVCLYDERGTSQDKRHHWTLATDRLEGQLNLRDAWGSLVAEVKGWGCGLRCYPTLPPGKPRGYTPLYLAKPGEVEAPTLTARQIAHGLADYLSHSLDQSVYVEGERLHRSCILPVSGGQARKVAAELDRRDLGLSEPNAEGWQSGRCPLHDDRRPSFSVNFTVGTWRCFRPGCGSGGLRSLAWRLGIRLRPQQHHHGVRAIGWEVTV